MLRKIIKIDEEKCNGCGLCATACHEGAIDIIDGKAKLVRENYCDGLGDCLPSCPTGAITFEEREAPEYDDAAVKKTQEESRKAAMNMTTEEIMKIEDENERRKLMKAKMQEEGGMALSDQTGSDAGAVLRRGEASDCSRLHSICLCKYARRVHEGQNDHHRMSEAGRYRLLRETH